FEPSATSNGPKKPLTPAAKVSTVTPLLHKLARADRPSTGQCAKSPYRPPILKVGHVKTQHRLDCCCAGWAFLDRRSPLAHVRVRQPHVHCSGAAVPAEPAAPPHSARGDDR